MFLRHTLEVLVKRLHLLLFACGFAWLWLGVMFTWLQLTPQVAQAALPADHPAIENGRFSPASLPISATARDLFLPGSQPGQIESEIMEPTGCSFCHGEGYSNVSGQDPETETWHAWQGSMMAQAGRDPVFYAALDIANADVPGGGQYCLRCHLPRGWLDGRADPADGSAMTAEDLEGVQCEVCHRMVDPFYSAENPDRDLEVLTTITTPVTAVGNSGIILDPLDYRRGPLLISETLGFDPHLTLNFSETLQSPFHEEAAFCGSCHNIDNPLLSWDETSQSYILNPIDTPAGSDILFPIERTYSEWQLSDYNSLEGVYAPEFGGNREHVSICQHCHMRAVDGVGGIWFNNPNPNRPDFPFHDMTGANTWVPQIIPLHPVFSSTFTGALGQARLDALNDGVERARYMLQNAADMVLIRNGDQLQVVVINQTGHKLPTGYVEGRRMWIQVEGYDINGTLVYTSGAYNAADGTLIGYHSDPTLKVYEGLHGLTADWAAQLGLPPGESFHFILNNAIVSDNRIPPRGYSFAAFNAAGAAPYSNWQPDPNLYAEGQYWDITSYTLPANVVTGTVRLIHQVASREYIEFLRDNNPNSGNDRGQILYDLWETTGRSQPEVMVEQLFGLTTPAIYLPVLQRP